MAKSPAERNLDEFLQILREECKLSQVQEILREKKKNLDKGKKHDVRVSAKNYEEVVETNLRQAIAEGYVTKDELYGLLREAEENGRQHIFFYRAKEDVAYYKDPEAVASKKWGKAWREQFPQFEFLPRDWVAADFRPTKSGESVDAPSEDWILKVYALGFREHEIERHTSTNDGKKITVIKREQEEQRAVLLCRYRSKLKLLEIRIPFGYGKEWVESKLKQMWIWMKPAVDQGDFAEWDLRAARETMQRDRQANATIYDIGATTNVDGFGVRTRMTAASEEEVVTVSPDAEKKMNVSVQAKEDCRELCVVWQVDGGKILQDELRTPLGSYASHEICIPSRTTRRAIDYVTYRLNDFA
jgi:hypothetical protein